MKIPTPQVQNDTGLLNRMNDDMKAAAPYYNPTNYWAYYEKVFLPELKEKGLTDFRRRKGSVLRSFGATDLIESRYVELSKFRLIHNKILLAIPGWNKIIDGLSGLLSRLVSVFPGWAKRLRSKPFRFASEFGKEMEAPPLEALEISLAGNPEDVFVVDGMPYTNSMLYYYMRYAFGAGHINLNQCATIAELGSGSGKNAEIVMKFHPHLTYLIFDISPQLYVCEQYLKSVFPGRVVGYEENRSRTNLDGLQQGKIYIFGAWHFPLLEKFKLDVFWNCASFQEMEPDVALNYLHYVNQSARRIYLMAKMDGKTKAGKAGDLGVLEPVTLEHYRKGLSNFQLDAMADCYYPNGKRMWNGYRESIWHRKPGH
ncbi:MAG: putative sugar O-methyltransferase [Flavobacteriales bacterium]|nr:putative sugar O-methyltransferase [Flavobacteriales bacterium]